MIETAGTKLPVTLLTGFLGSGKTTLLRRILTNPEMAGTAVLINEFGEIGLDHLLVKEVHGATLVLENGCICCELRGDLRATLRDLIDGRGRNGAPGDFDRIMIETTGLADPAPILRAIHLDPMLRNQIQLVSCVTTVDAQHAIEQIVLHPEAASQIAAADRLVITKSDLVASGDVINLVRRLESMNPTSRVVNSNAPDFDPVALVDGGLFSELRRPAEIRNWFKCVATGSSHGGRNDQGDGVEPRTEAGSGVASFSLRLTATIDWTAFGVWLSAFLHRHGDKVLRIKGLLNISEDLGPIVLHGVQNVVYPPIHLETWPDGDRSSRLVFIVRDLDPERVRHSLFAFLSAAQGSVFDVHAA